MRDGSLRCCTLRGGWDFNQKPLLVFWETTKACKLVCKHCRAEAIEKPLPDELTTEEGKRFIDQITEFGSPYPHLIMTGGDVLMRKDFWELAQYSISKGIRTLVAPSVTPLLTEEKIKRMKEIGIIGMSLSLDGARPEVHDEIRGIPGIFNRTVEVMKFVKSIGMFLQINTVVMKPTINDLPDVFKLIYDVGVDAWEVFFLIPTGRAGEELDLTPEEYWDVVNFLYDASKYGKVTIRTTEAPFYRVVYRLRVVMDEMGKDVSEIGVGELYYKLRSRLEEVMGPIPKEPPKQKRAPSAYTRDGYGIIFVAYNGDVYPSGFLPYKVGNVRERSLKDIYLNSDALKRIRDWRNFKSPCGTCEFGFMCGGSRARAYAYQKDPFGSDPACLYPKIREKLNSIIETALQFSSK
ncbi:coenzyme PQQ biosynthesis protein E [Ignicoccus islandicus DSM 13165]|uniref:Coenzyme PQQ biosynthesis protein E n=1 Tax=Ignicoccus islandicus DSM 13165 TaxID=940295 RepID=A0A0U3DWL7_9CREN|nr:TIGR04053 family radical SAM/SPASM domain-containing protein [Ignicoccus islandicus]ALU11882.1 coenzyme PQQ biosynthesis protein E [Ignicoccus islandicus DSM 13165]